MPMALVAAAVLMVVVWRGCGRAVRARVAAVESVSVETAVRSIAEHAGDVP